MSRADLTTEALQGYRAARGSACPHPQGSRIADAWIVGFWLQALGRAAPASVVASRFNSTLVVDDTMRVYVAPDGSVWHC